jgi:CRISPR-associated protein Cas1
MEPYRPFVDKVVLELIREDEISEELTKTQKTRLLQIPVLDVTINGRRSPLMLAVQQTTASLAKCFRRELRRVEYPELN